MRKITLKPIFMCLLLCALTVAHGCERPRITAHNLDRRSNERAGIPFYLPKPYLIISKNVRYIPSPSVGLTETVPIPSSFDSSFKEFSLAGEIKQGRNVQATRTVTETVSSTNGGGNGSASSPASDGAEAGSGDDKEGSEENGNDSAESADSAAASAPHADTANEAETNKGSGNGAGKQVPNAIVTDVVPAGSIEDGLIPHTFYTYQFVYLPDLTQKYGLDIRGGNGEFRGTMNLVNGWMNTGAGPFYFRDSSTAASIAATGLAIGNVIDSAAGLSGIRGGASSGSILPDLLKAASSMPHADVPTNPELADYAEIYIFEPRLDVDPGSPTGTRMSWHLLTTYSDQAGNSWPIRMNRPFLGTTSESNGRTKSQNGQRVSSAPLTDTTIESKIRSLLSGHGGEYVENSLSVEPKDPQRTKVVRVKFQVKHLPGTTVDTSGAKSKIGASLGIDGSAVEIVVVP